MNRRRLSDFERGIQDLHGVRVMRRIPAEIVHEMPPTGLSHETSLRLLFGALGVFWGLVLLALAAAMLIAGGAMIWGLFDPAQL